MPEICIEQSFTAQIWRMLIDDTTGLLFAELRSTEEKQVSFAAISLRNCGATFTQLVVEERWLAGIQAAHNGVLFIHGYQSAQSPVHKGIIAVDGTTGSQLWSNHTFNIPYVSVNGPVAYNTNISPPRQYLINEKTGQIVRPYNPLSDHESIQQIAIPQIIAQAPAYFYDYIDGAIEGNIHYLEYNNFIIVSLHAQKHGALVQMLMISEQAKVIYKDILNTNIQKLQPEAFVLHHNQLIYIKNRSTLKVLNL
jgi:hypothetical protein